jgi:hypothetical protein
MVFRSCHDLKNTVKKYCFLLNKYPDNGSYRKAFYSFRSKYRRKCKIEERKYKQQLCDDIYSNIKNDPRTFWNVINKIGNMSEKNDEDIQNKDDFIRYFENINNHSDKIPNSHFHNSIISHMNQMLEKLMGKQADDTFN